MAGQMPVVLVSPRLSWQSLRFQGGSQDIRISTRLFHPAASSFFPGLSSWFSSRYLLVLRLDPSRIGGRPGLAHFLPAMLVPILPLCYCHLIPSGHGGLCASSALGLAKPLLQPSQSISPLCPALSGHRRHHIHLFLFC